MQKTQSDHSFLTSYLPPKTKLTLPLMAGLCCLSFVCGGGSLCAFQIYDQNRPIPIQQMEILSWLVSTIALKKEIPRHQVWTYLTDKIGIVDLQHMKKRDFRRAKRILMMSE